MVLFFGNQRRLRIISIVVAIVVIISMVAFSLAALLTQ